MQQEASHSVARQERSGPELDYHCVGVSASSLPLQCSRHGRLHRSTALLPIPTSSGPRRGRSPTLRWIELGPCLPLMTFATRTIVVKRTAGTSRVLIEPGTRSPLWTIATRTVVRQGSLWRRRGAFGCLAFSPWPAKPLVFVTWFSAEANVRLWSMPFCEGECQAYVVRR